MRTATLKARLVSTIISQLAIYFALGVAWESEGAIGWMNYATTLYQLPLGLVGVAIHGLAQV